jgi:hypothetical protein
MHINYSKYIILITLHCFTFIFTQGISNNVSINSKISNEINAILINKISINLYRYPYRQLKPLKKPVNMLKYFNNNLELSPVLGLRYSNTGFELSDRAIPTIWITPGINLNLIVPVISPYSGVLFQAWGGFYKHSAYFMDKSSPDLIGLKPFEFHPEYSMEYFTKTKEPDWGVDFDQGQGGVALFSNKFEVYFGKFKSSLGPFLRGNLSLSLKTPSYPQFKLSYRGNDFFEFTWVIGELISELQDTNLTIAYNNNSSTAKYPWIKRGVIQHRFDFFLTQNIRIGLYEQIIYGTRNTPWQYLIPLTPYWSAQHAVGDVDNLQMGLDLDWLHSNGRTNFAFYVDEWAPFDTFDKNNHHNWIASQIGHTHLFPINNDIFYFRIENTFLAPQIYEHKFPINQNFNQGYPIGFWSKGDSFDFWFVMAWINESKFSPRVEFENTIFGEPKYEIGRKYLDNSKSDRQKISIFCEYNINGFIKIDLNFSKYQFHSPNNEKLSYLDSTIKLKYNISY